MAGLPRTLPELVKKAINGALQDVHVALPGQVSAWNAATNLADVQVMVQHPVWDDDNGRTYEDLGTLVGVPVMWPRAGGYVLTMPLSAGDTGLLVFTSTPIGEWRTSNQSSQPADASRHSIGWPVFVPGLFADTAPPSPIDVAARTAGVVFGQDGGAGQILVQGSIVKVGAGGDFLPTKADYTALLAALNTFASGLNAGTLTAQASALVTALGGVAAPAYTTVLKAK